MRASVPMFLSVLVRCSALLACNGAESAEPPGRGSAACRDLQDALCDFAADECHVVDRGSCDDMFRGIECKSDAIASNCSNALSSASCGMGPLGCDLESIVDAAPAIARCEVLVNAVCDRVEACGLGATDCAIETMQGLSCDQAISIDLRYEECLEAIEVVACEGFTVPPVCMNVVRVLPSSA